MEKDILFAFNAKDSIEWLAAYRVAMLSRVAVRSLTVVLQSWTNCVGKYPKHEIVIVIPTE